MRAARGGRSSDASKYEKRYVVRYSTAPLPLTVCSQAGLAAGKACTRQRQLPSKQHGHLSLAEPHLTPPPQQTWNVPKIGIALPECNVATFWSATAPTRLKVYFKPSQILAEPFPNSGRYTLGDGLSLFSPPTAPAASAHLPEELTIVDCFPGVAAQRYVGVDHVPRCVVFEIAAAAGTSNEAHALRLHAPPNLCAHSTQCWPDERVSASQRNPGGRRPPITCGLPSTLLTIPEFPMSDPTEQMGPITQPLLPEAVPLGCKSLNRPPHCGHPRAASGTSHH
jgi:hypothetical protein